MHILKSIWISLLVLFYTKKKEKGAGYWVYHLWLIGDSEEFRICFTIKTLKRNISVFKSDAALIISSFSFPITIIKNIHKWICFSLKCENTFLTQTHAHTSNHKTKLPHSFIHSVSQSFTSQVFIESLPVLDNENNMINFVFGVLFTVSLKSIYQVYSPCSRDRHILSDVSQTPTKVIGQG